MEKDPTLKDIFEIVSFIKDNAVSKTELKEDLKNFVTKQDLEVLTKEIKLEIGKARDAVLVHADTKSVDAIIESGKKINQHKEQDKNFKQKLVSVMKNHNLASASELKSLAQTI